MADIKDSVTLEFRDILLKEEKKPFPVIYMALDATGLTVGFKTFIPDELGKTMTLEQIKWFINRVVDIHEWEMERDASFRGTELYGEKYLSKIKLKENLAWEK